MPPYVLFVIFGISGVAVSSAVAIIGTHIHTDGAVAVVVVNQSRLILAQAWKQTSGDPSAQT